MLGVSIGSIPSFDRRKSGNDVDNRVGRVECRNVTGAIDHGTVHEDNVFKVDKIDLGGCVEGVSISLVLAMLNGARRMPAMLAAETATASEAIGVADERMSRPPAEPA